MDISTIQKRKFLNNLYKLYYSEGSKPSEQEVRADFNRYFSKYRFGLPVDVDYDLLLRKNIINPDDLNELMANTLLNLEVLYDCVFENNNELFSVVNVLNNKLDSLKARRKQLESKIDELLFENSNTDGYFYSFADTFSTADNVDLSLTTAHVDLLNNNVAIPKITSNISEVISVDQITSNAVSYSMRVDGQEIITSNTAENFDFVFDGLNDTYWKKDYRSSKPAIVALSVIIPLSTSIEISKVSGSIITASPVNIYVTCTPLDSTLQARYFEKLSSEEYNRFSFNIPSDIYSSVSITLVKNEPDRILSSNSDPYFYGMGFREIAIGSDYHDVRSVLVSNPIILSKRDNSLLEIASVAIDASANVPPETELKYYVAADTESYSGISDFNWIPIEPLSSSAQENKKFVTLASSNYNNKTIDYTDSDYTFIPLKDDSDLSSELNPAKIPFTEKTAYRIAAVPENEQVLKPYMLVGLSNFRHYGKIHSGNLVDAILYKSPEYWSSEISRENNLSVLKETVYDQIISTNTPLTSESSGFFSTNLLCQNAVSVSHKIRKSSPDFNLSVYLNGVMIADIPAGFSSAEVDWNFVEGVNNINILYDKNVSGYFSFSLMAGVSLEEYGTVFLDYYNYVDPIEFRKRSSDSVKIFTVDSLFGRREILSSTSIGQRSLIRYYSSMSDVISAVRYRVDLIRYSNPLKTPSVNSVKVKFRHSDG